MVSVIEEVLADLEMEAQDEVFDDAKLLRDLLRAAKTDPAAARVVQLAALEAFGEVFFDAILAPRSEYIDQQKRQDELIDRQKRRDRWHEWIDRQKRRALIALNKSRRGTPMPPVDPVEAVVEALTDLKDPTMLLSWLRDAAGPPDGVSLTMQPESPGQRESVVIDWLRDMWGWSSEHADDVIWWAVEQSLEEDEDV